MIIMEKKRQGKSKCPGVVNNYKILRQIQFLYVEKNKSNSVFKEYILGYFYIGKDEKPIRYISSTAQAGNGSFKNKKLQEKLVIVNYRWQNKNINGSNYPSVSLTN